MADPPRNEARRLGPPPAVLIVDDVEANLVALDAELSKLDCELVRARSGNEALRRLLKREFALILLDVQMPDIDGFEVARIARDHPATRDIPIVFVTAMHETEESTLRGYGAGAIDFLFKPINSYVLRSKVQVFLDLYCGRRRLADEIEAHKATLAELEAFNYSVSHDLRAPLRPLGGFSQILIDDYGDRLDETARGYLGRINVAAKRMSALIEDMLQLSRTGRAPVRAEVVDLAELATAVIAELRADDPSRQVTFTCPETVPVHGDPGLLRIALENLLRNAWKFTRDSVAGAIELGRRTVGARQAYFVADNGVGFDPAFADKLFLPFRRLHSSEFDGNGIGLAIVQRIIRRHDGEVWAESVLGQGATFLFTLGA